MHPLMHQPTLGMEWKGSLTRLCIGEWRAERGGGKVMRREHIPYHAFTTVTTGSKGQGCLLRKCVKNDNFDSVVVGGAVQH